MNPRPSRNEPDELPTALSRFVRIPFDDFLNLRKHLCTISADYQVFFSWALSISLRCCATLSSSGSDPASLEWWGLNPRPTIRIVCFLAKLHSSNTPNRSGVPHIRKVYHEIRLRPSQRRNGESWTCTRKARRQRIYSPPPLATREFPLIHLCAETEDWSWWGDSNT